MSQKASRRKMPLTTLTPEEMDSIREKLEDCASRASSGRIQIHALTLTLPSAEATAVAHNNTKRQNESLIEFVRAMTDVSGALADRLAPVVDSQLVTDITELFETPARLQQEWDEEKNRAMHCGGTLDVHSTTTEQLIRIAKRHSRKVRELASKPSGR